MAVGDLVWHDLVQPGGEEEDNLDTWGPTTMTPRTRYLTCSQPALQDDVPVNMSKDVSGKMSVFLCACGGGDTNRWMAMVVETLCDEDLTYAGFRICFCV